MIEGFNQPQIENISLLFKNCFSIPVFQRPYSWEKEEINELFEDINEYFKNNSTEDLFMGTVYMAIDSVVRSSITKYSIIDGQQRITTLSLMCLLLYHYAIKYNEEKDDSVINLKGYLWKKTDGRSYNKDEPLLNSSSLENKIMKHIFDTIFVNAGSQDLFDKLNEYNIENELEQRVLSNIVIINNNINSYILKSKDEEENREYLLNYIDFISDNLKFITITVGKGSIKKLFEIFESINSKGKQLDQIDLIKSYIFQNINDEDYNTYLNIWGNLIKETSDNLEKYMYSFIKAFIRFYVNDIGARKFKKLDKDLIKFYKKDNLSDALKAFLDDMNSKVKYYKDMFDRNIFIVNSSKFKFYTTCLRDLEYKHQNPLIFRAYCEYGNGNIDKNKLIDIVKSSFVYMFSFQTISNRESKDEIKTFEKIINDILENGFDSKKIMNEFKESLILDGISLSSIKTNILNYVGYSESKEKTASRILLAIYEFSDGNKIDYDKALYIMNNKDTIQIDHILPQRPDKDDEKCSYYIEGNRGEEMLKLKDNHDFDIPEVYDGMRYERFTTQVLDRIGNLRLMWRKDNIDKSNSIVKLKNYSTFNKYSKISKRATNLSNYLSKSEIFNI